MEQALMSWVTCQALLYILPCLVKGTSQQWDIIIPIIKMNRLRMGEARLKVIKCWSSIQTPLLDCHIHAAFHRNIFPRAGETQTLVWLGRLCSFQESRWVSAVWKNKFLPGWDKLGKEVGWNVVAQAAVFLARTDHFYLANDQSSSSCFPFSWALRIPIKH